MRRPSLRLRTRSARPRRRTTPWPTSPRSPAPCRRPTARPAFRQGNGGGLRVPAALVLIIAPVLAVAMFAGGVFVERAGVLGAPASDAPAPSSSPNADSQTELALIEQAWNDIQANYVD